MTARRTRARRGEGERLRGEIMSAAERLLVRHGDEEAVSIRAIARAVGCTPPSIYLHFTDKSQLFFEVCRARFQEFGAHVEQAVQGIADPMEALRARLRAYVAYGLDNPEAYRILFMSKPRTLPDSAEELPGIQAFNQLVDNVATLIDSGVAGPGDPRLVSIGLWAAAHGLTSLLLSLPDFDWPATENMVDALADLLTLGLKAR